MVEFERGESRNFRDKMLKEAIWDLEDETNILWNKMGECVKRIAREFLGSRGENAHFVRLLVVDRECSK